MDEYSGPIINKTSGNFITRDPLGIEGASTTIAGELCRLVTTVTPKPFMWAFLAWSYYDVFNHKDIIPYTKDDIDKYILKQNYYLCLGARLTDRYEYESFPGITYISNLPYKEMDYFEYQEQYLNGLGTLNNYYGALDRMELVVSQDRNTFEVFRPWRIRKEGERLALAFDKVISQTEYYKHYRFLDGPVPKEVLIELGNTVSSSLEGFDECKEILIDNLFSRNGSTNLAHSKDYLNYFLSLHKNGLNSEADYRYFLYDYFSPRGEGNTLPDELREIANGWEVLIGRQYFTVGLQMIWRKMVDVLSPDNPRTLNEWIEDCFADQEFYSMDEIVAEILAQSEFSFTEREALISKPKKGDETNIIKDAVGVMLSVYKRLSNRSEFSDTTRKYFSTGEAGGSVTLDMFFKLVNEYENRTIQEFVYQIIRKYLVKQHVRTAFRKLLEGKDNYFVEKVNDKYCGIPGRSYDYGFQGLRMVQLKSVMKDLRILEQ